MKVRIKTWEELEKKYGLDKFGDIENSRSNWIFSAIVTGKQIGRAHV